MSSSTGPSGHWPRSCACCAFRGGGSTSAPGRPLCTSLTDIVESRSHVVVLLPPSRVRLATPASGWGHGRGTEKCPRGATVVEARAIVTAYRGQPPAPLPGARRVGDFPRGERPARDAPRSASRARAAKTAQIAHTSRAGPTRVRLTLLCGANPTHLEPRGAGCAFCAAAARYGEIGAGHPGLARCRAGPVTDLHLTPTALRNKVNQYGGKCASRFPGQSPFGGCSGRKATGQGRRNRAM